MSLSSLYISRLRRIVKSVDGELPCAAFLLSCYGDTPSFISQEYCRKKVVLFDGNPGKLQFMRLDDLFRHHQ